MSTDRECEQAMVAGGFGLICGAPLDEDKGQCRMGHKFPSVIEVHDVDREIDERTNRRRRAKRIAGDSL